MVSVFNYIRIREWLSSKITLMIGVLLFFSYVNETPLKMVYPELLIYFLFTSMFMAVSYVANDFSDIEVDKLAGKNKIIATMPRWLIWASFLIMIVAGNVPIIILSSNKLLCIVLIVVTYIMGLAYSSLGLRFKERGVWGLVECSFAQRCMPLFLIVCIEDIKGLNILFLAGWVLISFLDGLRYILIHQSIDMENDIKSGVKTFVLEKKNNYRNSIVAFFVAVIVLLTIVFIPLWLDYPVLLLAVYIIYGAFEYCIYMVLVVYANKDWFVSYDSVPLEAFLNMIFPLVMGLVLICILGWRMIPYCIVMLAICRKPLMIKADLAKIYIKSKINKG